MFIVHTMPRHWVYLKMGLPDAYIEVTTLAINKLPTPVHSLCLMHLIPKNKTPCLVGGQGVCRCKSLAMTYFHTGIRTIIGAKSFHCP
ncbi:MULTISPECIES: hypothetical protein, partial [Comamonas]|uniref:hypothetical protein n=1 Tax=Comamonas TaxID=283 RepID=UPI00237E6DDB